MYRNARATRDVKGNWNVVALTETADGEGGTAGRIAERYTYTPCGEFVVLKGDTGSGQLGNALPTSGVGNPFVHQGLCFDQEKGSHQNRHRERDAKVGCFLQADPLGHLDGPSRYACLGRNPVFLNDALGLQSRPTSEDPDAPTSQPACDDPCEPANKRNEQGCPATEPGDGLGDGWCRETFFPFHPEAASCYRGYGLDAGKQCCYDANGCLICDDQDSAGTPDLVGPAYGEDDDGTCDHWGPLPARWVAHGVVDVIGVSMAKFTVWLTVEVTVRVYYWWNAQEVQEVPY